MMLLGLIIFSACTWAVFSKRFCDGLVTKHFFIFAAITAMLVVVDPANTLAAITSALFFTGGIAYWFFKHRACIREHWQIIIH